MSHFPVHLILILVVFGVFEPVCAPDPQAEGIDKLESFCGALDNLTKSMEQSGVEKLTTLTDQLIHNTSTPPQSADSARFLSDVYTFHSTPAKPAANNGNNVVVPRPPAFAELEEWNSESEYSDVDMHDDNLERSQHFECSGQSSVQHNDKPGTVYCNY